MTRWLLAVMVCALMAAGSGPATAQSSQWNALFDRIIRLEATVRGLQSRPGAPAGQVGTGTSAEMRSLLNEMRQMRMRLESMDARLREMERRSGKRSRNQTPPVRVPPQPRRQAGGNTVYPANPNTFTQNDLNQYETTGNGTRIFVELGDQKHQMTPQRPPAQVAGPQQPPQFPPAADGSWQKQPGQVASIPPTGPQLPPGGTVSPDGVERGTLDGNQFTPKSAAQVLFDRSSKDLRSRRFGAAEAGFKSLLSRYGKDKLASNAQFMLGETYYVQKNYRRAARSYLLGYRKYPKGGRAADSLLKLGMSLAKLGQKSQACGAFQQVQSKYGSSGRTVRLAEQEMKRVGC